MATIAVITLSNFPPAPPGQTYQAWVLHRRRWISLGTARPDARGGARLIAEGPDLTEFPEAIQVTQEPAHRPTVLSPIRSRPGVRIQPAPHRRGG